MSVASPVHKHLARWVLQREAIDSSGPDILQAAAERSCQKLCIRLARLVTPTGCQSLLARAIHLAAAEAPFLRGVRAGIVPGVCLEGLQECAQETTPEQRQDGLAAVVAHLIGLLGVFIGDDLTGRLIRDVWPEAPLGPSEAGTTPQEARS